MIKPTLDRLGSGLDLPRALLILLWALGLSSFASAQTPAGTIAGTVEDPMGWKVPGVEISARSVDTRTTRKVRTDATGRFEFRELPLGDYLVEAQIRGFENRLDRVALGGGSVRHDVRLVLQSVAAEYSTWGRPTSDLVGPTRRGRRQKPPECSAESVAAQRGGRVVLPTKTVDVQPSYTTEAYAAGPVGRVTVEGVITAEGRLAALQVIASSHPAFEKPLMNAVSLWEFDPTYLNCVPVETTLRVTFNFSHEAPR